MDCVRGQAAQGFQRRLLLGGNPGHHFLWRGRGEDRQTINKVRMPGGEGQGNAPARRPARDADRAAGDMLDDRRQIIGGGSNLGPGIVGIGIGRAVAGSIHPQQRHAARPGLRRIGIEAARTRSGVAQDDGSPGVALGQPMHRHAATAFALDGDRQTQTHGTDPLVIPNTNRYQRCRLNAYNHGTHPHRENYRTNATLLLFFVEAQDDSLRLPQPE